MFHAVAWGASAAFLYSAQTGDRGLIAKREAKAKMEAHAATLAEIRAEKAGYERRIVALSGEAVDRDLLDERLRETLNRVHRDDRVILLDR